MCIKTNTCVFQVGMRDRGETYAYIHTLPSRKIIQKGKAKRKGAENFVSYVTKLYVH